MTSIDDLLLEVLREAAESGDALAPSELLRAVAGLPNPVRALSDIDEGNIIFAAFEKEFAFVKSARITAKPIDLEDRQEWISLMRWLIRELSQWRDSDDVQRHKLVSLFVVTQSCDWGNVFWRALPDGPRQNAELGAALERMLSTSKAEFKPRQSGPVPIWEEESVDEFRQADEQGNWVEIADKCHVFRNALFPNWFQMQTVRYLYRYGFDRLIRALGNVNQTPVAMQVAVALSNEEKLCLANASDNRHIQFICVLQTLSGHPKPTQLPHAEKQILTDLLLKVANEDTRWEAWMQVFNLHPLRYPALQAALGEALAVAPERAVKTYVNTIGLYAKPAKPDESRRCVAECLREFRRAATPERRCALWTVAHERWLTWEFDRTIHDRYLFEISWSELDYAVVAFAVECMDEDARNKAKDAISSELRLVETAWNESLSHCVTQWNRQLSKFQPYAHACATIGAGGDWLTETQTYRPSELVTDYLKMMFEIN
jgi:hypothetical protein